MREILAQIKQYKKATLLTPLFSMLEVVMEVLLPYVTALIIDKGLYGDNIAAVYGWGALVIVLACFSLAFGALGGKYGAEASSGLACNLREAIYNNIQRFSFSNIDKFSTAGLVTRMTTDVTNVQNAFQMCIRIAVRAPLMMIFSMIMSFYINARLSVFFVVGLVFLLIVLGLIIRRTTKQFSEAFKQYDALNASVQENVTAIRVVKSYVREDYEKKKFSKAAKKIYDAFVKAEGLLALNNPAMMLVVYSCIIGISWLGAQFITGVSGEVTMTTGELSSMLSYVMSIMMSLMMVSMIFVMLTMSAASIRRISEVLKEEPDMVNPENPVTEVKDGSITFEKVYFSYRQSTGKEALTNINLNIHSGETIGIIGGTGSGKSTFVSLISRLYDVSTGRVLVGGRDVRDYDMETLRNEVSVVLQNNVLFSGTVLDNLRWGDENATEEECIAAAKAACADEFVSKMPDGYNTMITRGGTNVSGGQKQRLCIARALVKKPKVLILDDSTSAVDTATDAKIRKAFAEMIPGTTKLIIAQRISSVQEADRILVLDDGKVDAFDTHENLLKTNDIYREIYESQSKGGGDFDHHAAGKGA